MDDLDFMKRVGFNTLDTHSRRMKIAEFGDMYHMELGELYDYLL